MQLTDDAGRQLAWLFTPDDEVNEDPDEPEELTVDPESDQDDDADGGIELGIESLAGTWEDLDDEHEELDTEWVEESTPEERVETTPVEKRDQRIREYDSDAPHGDVRAHVREHGVAEDLQETLGDLGHERHNTTSAEGDVLDMRNVIRRLAGDTTVDEYYRHPTTYPTDDLAVGVSIDMSGSMGKYEQEAKAALGAFLFAVDKLGGAVVANAWQHARDGTKLRMLTAPGERFRWRHLDAVEPGGGDPIARGMSACGDLLQRTTADEQLLFVISDGKPTVNSLDEASYGSVLKEAEHVADRLRRQGVTVFGVGFGSVSEDNLETMFGEEFAVHVELPDLADTLADRLLDELDVGNHEVIA
jgi:hypothetical protein